MLESLPYLTPSVLNAAKDDKTSSSFFSSQMPVVPGFPRATPFTLNLKPTHVSYSALGPISSSFT